MWILATCGFVILAAVSVAVLMHWGSHWGATNEELASKLPGDLFFGERRGPRSVMTRGVSIQTPPESVWPWLAQLGRGAGFYSYDRVDNGAKTSARHIVSWIPDPQLGDATVIGFLRHLDPGHQLVWWIEDCRWIGATWRGAFEYRITAAEGGSRLLCRITAEATGRSPWPALWMFQIVDSIMSRRQLLTIKKCCERYGARPWDPDRPETGDRDQYQEPFVTYASGDLAGASGEAEVNRWREAAHHSGLLRPQIPSPPNV